MTNKRILLITQNFYPEIGSAANRMKNLYQLLKLQDYDVTVLTTEPSYPYKNMYQNKNFWNDQALNMDKDIHRIQIKNRKYSISMINRLFYYLEMFFKMVFYILKDKNSYDFVLVTSPPIFVGMTGLLAKLRYKTYLFLDIRDLWPESLKGVGVFNYSFIIFIFNKIEKHLYKKADHIIVNSKGFKKHILQRTKISESNITFLPNGARNFELLSLKEKKEFKVIYAGNLGLAQDVEMIKQLAKQLNQYQIPLTVIGYGMEKNSLIDFVKANNLNNVKFKKPLTREKCLKIIAEHSIGVVTLKDREVFETVLPGKIIDYLTCMVPVVASVSGYSEQIIKKEKVGLVVSSKSVEEMLQKILYLKESQIIRNEMELNCREYTQSKFLWEKNIPLLMEVIESQNVKTLSHFYKEEQIK
ncbi:glycosyltransferase WbuB [Heyndrickxia sporothermodurans]|nr:glycosyltransferase WbuB [Heyndrickxia sporothermodurans]